MTDKIDDKVRLSYEHFLRLGESYSEENWEPFTKEAFGYLEEKDQDADFRYTILTLIAQGYGYSCLKQSSMDDCEKALEYYKQSLQLGSRYQTPKNFHKVQKLEENNAGYLSNNALTNQIPDGLYPLQILNAEDTVVIEYGFDALKNLSKKNSRVMGSKLYHLKQADLEKKSGREKLEEYRHKADNVHSKKFSALLTKEMQYDPALPAPTYIRREVFNRYDTSENEWVALQNPLVPYKNEVQPTHTYKGPLFVRNAGIFHIYDIFHGVGKDFLLPIPDGFALDSRSVLVDGKPDGFELLYDPIDGAIYLKLTETRFGRLTVTFGMRGKSPQILPLLAEGTNEDPIPFLDLPPHLKRLVDQGHFYDARSKFETTRQHVLKELQYPQMRQILNGTALFPAKTGVEFYQRLSEMKIADCDVANSYGAILLRKQNVPTRLVTGFLIDKRGVGFHGWLEYYNENLKAWISGDLTPPFEAAPALPPKPKQKGTTAAKKSEPKKQPSPSMTRYEKVQKGSFQLRLEKGPFTNFSSPFLSPAKQDNADQAWNLFTYDALSKETGPLKTFRLFRGEQWKLSEPQGRYLTANGTLPNTKDVYDLKEESFFTIPIPEKALEDTKDCRSYSREEKIWETIEGPVIEYQCVTKTEESSRQGQYFVKRRYFNHKGKIVFSRDKNEALYSLNVWVSKYSPYFYEFDVPEELPNGQHFEDGDGRLHWLTPQKNKVYKLEIPLPHGSQNKPITILEKDLPQPLFEIPEGMWATEEMSPTGNSVAIRLYPKDHESENAQKNTVVVFDGTKEVYRVPFEALPQKGNLIHHQKLSINDDLSASWEQTDGGDKAYAIRFAPSEGEVKMERVDWILKMGEKSRQEAWVTVNAGEEKMAAILPHSKYPYVVDNIAQDGSWIGVTTTPSQVPRETLFISPDSNNTIPFTIESGNGNGDDCFNEGATLYCWHKNSGAIVNPVGDFAKPFFKTPYTGYSTARRELSNNKREEAALWNIALEKKRQRKGEKVIDVEQWADAGIVMTETNNAEWALSEMLKNHPGKPPMESLQALLTHFSQNREDALYYKWLLISAAHLFEEQKQCEGSQDDMHCIFSAKNIAAFLKEEGCSLAERILPDIQETMLFPNDALITKGLGFFLEGVLLKDTLCDLTLLDKMMTQMLFNPDKTAKILLEGAETGLIDLMTLPEREYKDETILKVALREALEEKRTSLFGQHLQSFSLEQIQPLYNRYRSVEEKVRERFGDDAIPPPFEQDW